MGHRIARFLRHDVHHTAWGCQLRVTNQPLVLIEWEDSAQALPRWQWLTELAGPKVVRCLSAGFLVKDGKKEKLLAISVATSGADDMPDQASGIIAIPTRCIVRMKRLTGSSLGSV